MNSFFRNVLAVLAGFFVGSLVNMGLVNLGMIIFPLPEGADVSTMEGLRESMKLFTPLNFLFPFLAHALGTFVGAFLAAKLGVSYRMQLALGIGVLFLLGGITMIALCGGPAWFIGADLSLAYLPMGYIGGKLAIGGNAAGSAASQPGTRGK